MLSHINGIITEYSYAGIDVEFKGNEETGYSLKIKNEKTIGLGISIGRTYV